MAAHPLPEQAPAPVTTDVCGASVTATAGQTITWQNNNGQDVTCTEDPPNQVNWPLTVTNWTVPKNGGTKDTSVKSNAPSNSLGYTFSRSVPPCTNGSGRIIIR